MYFGINMGHFLIWLLLTICKFENGHSIFFPLAKKCARIRNITDVKQIAPHKYMMLEDCLYYQLAFKVMRQYGLKEAISDLPPTKIGTKKIKIQILKAILNEIDLVPSQYEMKMTGALDMSWYDYRLQWNQRDYKMDTLRIKSSDHIWVPKVDSKKMSTLWRVGDFVSLRNIKTSWKGNVTARMEFRLLANCQTDHRNYPLETINCCSNFDYLLNDDLLEYTISNNDMHLNVDKGRIKKWDVKYFGAKTEIDPENQHHRLLVCLSAARKSPSLKLELQLPLLISAALVVIAPFFGSMHVQIFVKLFAIFVQFLCFQFSVELMPLSSVGNTVPKIYRFYQFTLIIMLFSIFATLILNALSKIDRTIPPSHQLQLIASALNKYLCCSNNGGGPNLDSQKSSNGESMKTPNQYNQDWKEMFIACNNLLSLLLTVIYVIVSIVINA